MERCKYCGKSKGGYRKPYHRNCKLAFENGKKSLSNKDIKKLEKEKDKVLKRLKEVFGV